MIELSILFFKNENVINLGYYVLLLTVIFLISRSIFADDRWSLLATVVTGSNSLLLDQLIRSLLDLPFMLCFLLALYFFIRGQQKNINLYLSSLFWGCAFSIKFFPAYVFIFMISLGIIWYKKRSVTVHFLLSQLIVIFAYLISHSMYFYYHPSFVEFIRFKKWTISWWSGSPILVGNILRNLVTGSHIDSTGILVPNKYWSVLWPIFFGISLCAFMIKNKSTSISRIRTQTILWLFTCVYLMYVMCFTGGIQKFLLPVWPFAVILTLYTVQTILAKRVPTIVQRKAIHT